MSLERFLPNPVKRTLGAGALVLAVGACGGGQPVPSSSPDSRSSVPIPTQAVTLEPTLKPTAELTLEPTPSPSPTQEPIYTDCVYCFWMPDLPRPLPNFPNLQKPTPFKNVDCGGVLPNATEVFSSGCAGENNLFLQGHAYGVFKPLRDAYTNGLLKEGELAYYTNGIGQRFTYEVAWVDHPTVAEWGKGSSWAATPTPVITLDTCDDGIKADGTVDADAYRIIVGLVPTS